ncbi:uracil-DNA glycosylase [Conexibacter sp. SYSU D00693]|uniref:uracil-DNA glycosylase n=1 Tax=Conexibacter sp. SYSU D00693 TaxID=2812560 RepID=UPI00196A6F10|nr:uracil-DNA glycosylase [Conexibacter sp. SYSU D00693]
MTVTSCRRCPRLVAWREEVAAKRRAAFADEHYWGRPIPSLGDPEARIVLLGLAPAAHGANRTGRVFCGDRSGDFLFEALHRTGLSAYARNRERTDPVALNSVWITAAVRCAPPANKPLPVERDTCLPWTAHELAHMEDVRVVVCLGAFAWDAALRLRVALGHPPLTPRPKFGHGALARLEPWPLLGTFHPSQQNTFTGRLTPQMLDDVLLRAREIAQV